MSDDPRQPEYAMSPQYESVPPGGVDGPPAGPSPVAIVLRTLQGRYRWAIALSVVLAGVGVYLGVVLPVPKYRCSGIIEIVPKTPKILFNIEENQITNVGSFVLAQVRLVMSRRVVDIAMASPEWKALGRGIGDEATSEFQMSLSAVNPKNTLYVEVAFTDPDPAAATVAVNQVIKAYMKIVDEIERERMRSTVGILEQRRTELNDRLSQIRKDVLAVSGDLGSSWIDMRHTYLISSIQRDDALLHTIDTEIEELKLTGALPAATDPSLMTPELAAVKDGVMNGLLLKKEDLLHQVEFLETARGRGPNHPEVVAVRDEIAMTERRIADRLDVLRGTSTGPISPELAIQERVARRDRLLAAREAAAEEAKSVARKQTLIANLLAEAATVGQQIDEVKRRLEQIDVESDQQGRIRVLTQGSRPFQPSEDKRLMFGFAGLGGGIALGFGLVLAWGLRDARVRYLDDVDGDPTRYRFLGMLPEIGGAPAEGDPADAVALADYCIHHVRTLLQLGHAAPGRIVALTSPSPGAGKTTLGMALGMSFGATGTRTLLIDCDLVGQGATRSLRALVADCGRRALECGDAPADRADARGRIGSVIAARAAPPTDREFDELVGALRERASSDPGSAASALRAVEGYLRYGAERGRGGRRRGMSAALEGRPLEECVLESGVPMLDVLPAGDLVAGDAESLSPSQLAQMFAACRERYETILVDTGPILGSLEAALVTVRADEVVVIVNRGESRRLLDEALARLHRIGASVTGVFFNRALTRDAVRSSFASRSASRSRDHG